MQEMDLSLYGVILAAIFSTLQFIHQGGDGSGGLKVESRIHLQHTVSLCASISLITLTSGKPLPPKISHRISLLFAVLACAFVLSAAVPDNLCGCRIFRAFACSSKSSGTSITSAFTRLSTSSNFVLGSSAKT